MYRYTYFIQFGQDQQRANFRIKHVANTLIVRSQRLTKICSVHVPYERIGEIDRERLQAVVSFQKLNISLTARNISKNTIFIAVLWKTNIPGVDFHFDYDIILPVYITRIFLCTDIHNFHSRKLPQRLYGALQPFAAPKIFNFRFRLLSRVQRICCFYFSLSFSLFFLFTCFKTSCFGTPQPMNMRGGDFARLAVVSAVSP